MKNGFEFFPRQKSRNFVLGISMCRIVARSHLQILVTIIASALGLFRATNVIYLVPALSVSCGPPSRRHCLPVSKLRPSPRPAPAESSSASTRSETLRSDDASGDDTDSSVTSRGDHSYSAGETADSYNVSRRIGRAPRGLPFLVPVQAA